MRCTCNHVGIAGGAISGGDRISAADVLFEMVQVADAQLIEDGS